MTSLSVFKKFSFYHSPIFTQVFKEKDTENKMEILEKARVLADSGRYDSCGPKACEVKINSGLGGIYHAKTERQDCKLFKTLMTNACSFDCKYCQNSNCKKRVSYEPEELSKLFMYLVRKAGVHGLFLSSGVAGDPDKTTQEMIKAVKLLRYKHKFRGYIHFKVLPGTSKELIKQASELSNRMSINIEAPNKTTLSELSSCKDYKTDILRRQAWISKLSKSQTTQILLTKLSTDEDVLKMMKWEYEKLKLKRIYFSAFKPVKGTKMENEKAVKDSRQNHLYNADFLLRDYDFSLKEIKPILREGMLPGEDPKLALAKANFDRAVDINELNYQELIRIPGIGPKTATKITKRKGKITTYEQLHKLGGSLKRAKPFIKVGGKTQKMLSEF
jgi:predicted DNA-binding helix-hairpin-helix protein